MIGSCELKARVEESLGTVLDPDFFGQAEQYARRKLDMCNERADDLVFVIDQYCGMAAVF